MKRDIPAPRLLARARALNRGQWLLLVEASWFLLCAWVAVRVRPFARIAEGLGRPRRSVLDEARPRAADPAVEQVAWATRAVSRRFSWIATCLVRSLAARRMLQRRGRPSVLHFGVRRDDAGRLEAHAWLSSGARVLVGAASRRQFFLVSAFAEGRE